MFDVVAGVLGECISLFILVIVCIFLVALFPSDPEAARHFWIVLFGVVLSAPVILFCLFILWMIVYRLLYGKWSGGY